MTPPLQQCCCCCTLKTGSLVIATLGWIFTVVKIFGMAGVSVNNSQHGASTLGNDMLGYRIGYAVISLVACILLVVGIFKNNRYYMILWLVIDCLECIGATILCFVLFVLIFTIGGEAIVVIIIAFILSGLTAVLCWYLWVVVYSYYVEIRESTEVVVPGASNVYYSPTSNQPPPYDKERQQQMA